MVNKIKTEEELIKEAKCTDLCFLKDIVKDKKKLVEDKIYDDDCPCTGN